MKVFCELTSVWPRRRFPCARGRAAAVEEEAGVEAAAEETSLSGVDSGGGGRCTNSIIFRRAPLVMLCALSYCVEACVSCVYIVLSLWCSCCLWVLVVGVVPSLFRPNMKRPRHALKKNSIIWFFDMDYLGAMRFFYSKCEMGGRVRLGLEQSKEALSCTVPIFAILFISSVPTPHLACWSFD
jgi:hypothetical protein